MCKFSEDNRKRLGNVVLYIASHTQHPSKTKVLKLLYLMEEHCVLSYHMPFLALPYEVWKAGPVAKDVFIDLSDGPVLLSDYVKTTTEDNGQYIEPCGTFDSDEFSANELKMMDDVLKKYGVMTAKELVQLTHRKGSLWYKAAEENGLLELFDHQLCNSSEVKIDFSRELTPCDAAFYKENLEDYTAENSYNILHGHA